MGNYPTIKFFPGYSLLLTRKLFLAFFLAILAVSGVAKMYEQPRSFALKDNLQEQVAVKVMPKVDTERLLTEDRARGKGREHPRSRSTSISHSTTRAPG